MIVYCILKIILEQIMGFEPTSPTWKAGILDQLYDICIICDSWGIRTPDPFRVKETLWTNWAKEPLVVREGLEPSTFAVSARRSNQLSYLTIYYIRISWQSFFGK